MKIRFVEDSFYDVQEFVRVWIKGSLEGHSVADDEDSQNKDELLEVLQLIYREIKIKQNIKKKRKTKKQKKQQSINGTITFGT